ncbi:hypothetical protein NAEGRDRAFT_65868 [Naegleria gruberi]|uniref:N-acetyltransferase domain-containing protein n=1 Tax=Naegleria gruberi TaxID=5762 RepID=D2VAI2_NAEGR|nr:uncharacterized protein NAEGRDRAFT_65868 [Naegleria gruberi]EFC45960.1 hypothetical protein NAEGRDRAFT_65868 [Naegleria gruberi]|eukprot:XP_002678704.1 hypothetical protein NAEGRDRAFT_65868 [Naegleria gruberi strain NEG-M]
MSYLRTLSLYEHWDEFVDETVKMIIEEWSSSPSVRKVMLLNDKNTQENNNSPVPVSLILVNEENQVVSHAKLIKSQENVYIIETVVTRKDKRGLGYGKRIVDEMCLYFKNNFITDTSSTLYLSTKIPKFYEKSGFITSQPPEACGKVCSNLNSSQINSLSAMLSKRNQTNLPLSSESKSDEVWMKWIVQ